MFIQHYKEYFSDKKDPPAVLLNPLAAVVFSPVIYFR